MRVEFKFGENDEVQDKVTGVKCRVIGMWYNATGVNRYFVAYRSKTDCIVEDWMDEERLVLVAK